MCVTQKSHARTQRFPTKQNRYFVDLVQSHNAPGGLTLPFNEQVVKSRNWFPSVCYNGHNFLQKY